MQAIDRVTALSTALAAGALRRSTQVRSHQAGPPVGITDGMIREVVYCLEKCPAKWHAKHNFHS